MRELYSSPGADALGGAAERTQAQGWPASRNGCRACFEVSVLDEAGASPYFGFCKFCNESAAGSDDDSQFRSIEAAFFQAMHDELYCVRKKLRIGTRVATGKR
jgi:hypothetical protein